MTSAVVISVGERHFELTIKRLFAHPDGRDDLPAIVSRKLERFVAFAAGGDHAIDQAESARVSAEIISPVSNISIAGFVRHCATARPSASNKTVRHLFPKS